MDKDGIYVTLFDFWKSPSKATIDIACFALRFVNDSICASLRRTILISNKACSYTVTSQGCLHRMVVNGLRS